MTESQADTIISNCYVVTMNDRREYFASGAIAVSGNRIVAVGRENDVLARYRARRTIDAGGGIVHPGFVDCHVHFMNAARGAFPDTAELSIGMNLYRRWWDGVNEEDERASTQLNCIEMLSNGTTCFFEAGTLQYPDSSAEAAENVGIRGFVSDPFLWDMPASEGTHQMTRSPRDHARSLKLLGNQLKRNRGEPLVRASVVLFGLGSASEELMRAAKTMADQHNAVFSQHQSFDAHDSDVDAHRFGKRALCHYAEKDIIGENCMFSHMNALSADELQAIKQSRMSVAWCPATAMYLGTGATIHGGHLDMMRMGVNVSLACDGAASGCRYDIGLQGLLALLASREKMKTKSAFSAEDVLELATRGGAKAVGMERQIG